MSKKDEIFTTPVGRLVQGSLYRANTTDADGNALVYRSGEKQGEPRQEYYMAVAIPKNPGETHWSQTVWGKIIYAAGVAGFPAGQHQLPQFAWKITDGDSISPNTKGVRPCDCEGFAGCWVLRLKGSIKPKVCDATGASYILEENYVNLGDYVQVAGTVSGNDSMQQPGVYLNPGCIAFRAYGERIITGIDPKSVGFGQDPLPAGASLTPLAQMAAPPMTTPPAPQVAPPPYPIGVPAAPSPVAPPTPAAPAPARTMTAKASGMSYESFIAAGWNDTQLIQGGYMTV